MTTESAAVESASPAGLKKGAIGIVAVIFMAVANAAPITAMTGNTPIAVGYGNGLGAPAGFLFATIILPLFAPSTASSRTASDRCGAWPAACWRPSPMSSSRAR
mgnify:CR=1 FL=1